jgi:hypothetical protein
MLCRWTNYLKKLCFFKKVLFDPTILVKKISAFRSQDLK